ncbi:MAG: hypothetical protein ACI360_08885 [Atopobiaceae bacterium]
MKRLVRMELQKAFRNPWLVVALSIAIALAVYSAVGDILARYNYGIGKYDYKYLSPSPDSCFRYWISMDFIQPTSTLLFHLLPLLAVIPYAWSFRTELQSGYLMQVTSRQTLGRYLTAKGIAVFLTGASVAMVPLVVNFLILACFVPAYMPDITAVIYIGIDDEDLWSWFLYNLPLIYVLLYTLLAGVLSGLWALFVHALSFFIDNRVALLSAPYLGLLGIQFVTDRIWLAMGDLSGVELGLSANMRAGTESYLHNGWVILAEGAILLALSLAFSRWCTRRDAI